MSVSISTPIFSCFFPISPSPSHFLFVCMYKRFVLNIRLRFICVWRQKGHQHFLISLLRFYVANNSPLFHFNFLTLTRLDFQHSIKYPYYGTVYSFLIFHCVHAHLNMHTKGSYAHTHFSCGFLWSTKQDIYRIREAII